MNRCNLINSIPFNLIAFQEFRWLSVCVPLNLISQIAIITIIVSLSSSAYAHTHLGTTVGIF